MVRRATPPLRLCALVALVAAPSLEGAAPSPAPLAVSSTNPAYFRFRGRTVALITSAEHYGGLINLDFNYTRYFDALRANGFTLTQAFAGSYVEPDSDCNPNGTNPAGNTLSPANGSFIAPWQRTAQPGGSLGGGKFDLTKYDEQYFARLQHFVSVAGARGIVVQVALFCGYDATHEFIWANNPMNPANNINALAGVNRTTVYTLRAGGEMLDIQLEMARRVAAALKPHDNAMLEVVFTTDGTGSDWARKIVGAVKQADAKRLVVLPVQWIADMPAAWRQTLIANCGAGSNCSAPSGSGFTPPTAAAAEGPRPSILDSAGSAAAGLDSFRQIYWMWMVEGGGALYNLDWAYTVAHEAGTKQDEQTTTTPSGPAYESLYN